MIVSISSVHKFKNKTKLSFLFYEDGLGAVVKWWWDEYASTGTGYADYGHFRDDSNIFACTIKDA
jgi:hypothetical protein